MNERTCNPQPITRMVERVDQDAGSAVAGVRVVDARRARRRAASGTGIGRAAPAHAGDVRERGPSAPATRSVPVVPRAVRCLRRHLLAALRLGGARHGHLRAGGRDDSLEWHAAAALPEAPGTRHRTRPHPDVGPAGGRGERVVQAVFDRRRVAGAARRRSGAAAHRTLRQWEPSNRRRVADIAHASGTAIHVHRPRGRTRRASGDGRPTRRAADHAPRAGRDRQDPIGDPTCVRVRRRLPRWRLLRRHQRRTRA